MSQIKQLKLWKVLVEKGSDEQRSTTLDLALKASGILDRIIETFPTYTLHNSTHALNVAKLMADLLGKNIHKLSALEASLLILSAFWHDIGMVFSEIERDSLESDQDWQEFLNKKPSALILYNEDGFSLELAEWYCRWRHADRVFLYLDRVPNEDLKWGNILFRKELGELCRSHNQNINDIKISNSLQTNFIEEADLKFCAILLRLADILDFDNSRSPEGVYRLLGLQNRDTKRNEMSDVEWRKHLHSDGFRFPQKREQRYELGFIAGPNHPAVEYDIREFLNIIQEEFDSCQSLLSFCNNKWKDFILPGKINKDNIISSGYIYGEYRFSLDQVQVLDLLMGENLYQDKTVFLREILQNAIDTSRLREYYEKNNGSKEFKVKSIDISEWRDRDGYLWIRFDDFGMGMNMEIIQNHLLKVGSSYYKTPSFIAEIIRSQQKGSSNFTPISRYGIGLLSCFIACDKVEISTRHLDFEGKSSEPIRLSLSGLHGFYKLQAGNISLDPMPSQNGNNLGNRINAGTSIAVRLDARKESGIFNTKQLLENYIFSSPIPIKFNDKPLGLDYESIVENPFCENTSMELGSKNMELIYDFLCNRNLDAIKINFKPINLTKYSNTPNYKGQLLITEVLFTEKWLEFKKKISPLFNIEFENKSMVSEYEEIKELGSSFKVFIKLESTNFNDKSVFIKKIEEEISQSTETKIKECFSNLIALVKNAKGISYSISKKNKYGRLYLEDSYRTEKYYLKGYMPISIQNVIQNLPHSTKKNLNDVNKNKSHLISHNGVIIPPKLIKNDHFTYKLFPFYPSIYFKGEKGNIASCEGCIALGDSLRPDVDVSRGTLKNVSISIYSNVILGLYKAALNANLDESIKINFTEFASMVISKVSTYYELENEQTLSNLDWFDIPLFSLVNYDHNKSINQIKAILKEKDSLKLSYWPDGWSHESIKTKSGGDYRTSFLRLIGSYFAQKEFNLQIKIINQKVLGFFINKGNPRKIKIGQSYFPPYIFIPFTENVFCVRDCGFNLDHPLSIWLIDLTPALSEEYPGIFEQLKNLMTKYIYYDFFNKEDRRPIHIEINDVLKRMKFLKQEYRPEDSLFLSENDVIK